MTIGKVFAEADRRDPAMPDLDRPGGRGRRRSACSGQLLSPARMAIVIDFIHVLNYLWKAAWCFHAPRDPAMEDWVIAQALDILHGRAGEVITGIQALAAEHPPKPGGEHAEIIRKHLFDLEQQGAWDGPPAGPGRRLA